MHAYVTAVTTQSNKIVSNDVEDNRALLETACGKNVMDVLASPVTPDRWSPAVAGAQALRTDRRHGNRGQSQPRASCSTPLSKLPRPSEVQKAGDAPHGSLFSQAGRWDEGPWAPPSGCEQQGVFDHEAYKRRSLHSSPEGSVCQAPM